MAKKFRVPGLCGYTLCNSRDYFEALPGQYWAQGDAELAESGAIPTTASFGGCLVHGFVFRGCDWRTNLANTQVPPLGV